MTPSPYPCIRVRVPLDSVDEFAIAIERTGALAIEERDATTMTKAQGKRVELTAGYSDARTRDDAYRTIARISGNATAQKLDITDQRWRNGWREYFQPVVLERIQIITPWMDPPSPHAEPIVIDPGRAFGTGGHATTKMILVLLEKMHSQGHLPKRILDVGSGSGVLSIAAAKLGVTDITAIDVDPEAVIATRENAKFNDVAPNITTRRGEALHESDTWPLVLANLELSIFSACHEDVTARVEMGGTLIASGVLCDQVKIMLSLFPGFELTARLDEEDWSALALGRQK